MVKSLSYKLVWDKNALDNLIGILTYLKKQSDWVIKYARPKNVFSEAYCLKHRLGLAYGNGGPSAF